MLEKYIKKNLEKRQISRQLLFSSCSRFIESKLNKVGRNLQERMVDALALRGEEGRDKLR
jgi:hypothetical protein